MLRHADTIAAHPDNVFIVAITLLDLHRRENQRAFLIDVGHVSKVGRRTGIAAICLMRLGEREEAQLTVLIDDWRDETMVRCVRIALVGAIVEIAVTSPEIRMVALHRLTHQVRADQGMDRQAFGPGLTGGNPA